MGLKKMEGLILQMMEKKLVLLQQFLMLKDMKEIFMK